MSMRTVEKQDFRKAAKLKALALNKETGRVHKFL